MIQASDLRIGNWINLSLREDISIYGKVLSIGSLEQEFEQVYCECEESFEWAFKDNYTGIPLTPEILEKCGLKDIWIKESWKIVEDISGGESFGWTMKVRNANYNKEIEFAYFKYLHDLQNLYYALTKQELNYKP